MFYVASRTKYPRTTDEALALHASFQRYPITEQLFYYGRIDGLLSPVLEIDLPAATGVDAPAVAVSPNLMLDPPRPNPVRDAAVFRFAARSDAPVRLDVYDVGGRHVASVAAGGRGDGVVRTATWIPDGAPSGVYFAVLRAGEERVSRKMVVAR